MSPDLSDDEILELARALQPLIQHPARPILADLAQRERANACERAVLSGDETVDYYKGFVAGLTRVLETADKLYDRALDIAKERRGER